MSRGLNWSSLALVQRLIWEVSPQVRECRCPSLVEVRSFSGHRVIGEDRCRRPGGHRGPHLATDGRLGRETSIVSERDPLVVAGEVLRRAEIAVRRSKRSKG